MRLALGLMVISGLGCAPKDLLQLPAAGPEIQTRILAFRTNASETPVYHLLPLGEPEAVLFPASPEAEVYLLDYAAPLDRLGFSVKPPFLGREEPLDPIAEPDQARALHGSGWEELDSLAGLNLRVQYDCPRIEEEAQQLGAVGDTIGSLVPTGAEEALVVVQKHEAFQHRITETRLWSIGPGRAPTPWDSSDVPAEALAALTAEDHTGPPSMVDPITGDAYFLTSQNRLVHLDAARNFVDTSTLPSTAGTACAQFAQVITGGTGRQGFELFTLGLAPDFEDLSALCRWVKGSDHWEDLGWRAAGGPYGPNCKWGLERYNFQWTGPEQLVLTARRPVRWTYDGARSPQYRAESFDAAELPIEQYCRAYSLFNTSLGDFGAFAVVQDFAFGLTHRESAWRKLDDAVNTLALVEWKGLLVASGFGYLKMYRFTVERGQTRLARICPKLELQPNPIQDLVVRGDRLMVVGGTDVRDGLYVSWLKTKD
ncbi:MAG: hypothetical protein U1E65_22305 [Myxococcota bacterium]